MKARLFAAAVALLIGLSIARVDAQGPERGSDDEMEIRRLVASHAAASQQGDLHGLVSVYHTDADVRYSDGTVLRGRSELEKSYREDLSSDPKGLAHSHPASTIHVRFLRPDVAFVDVESVTGTTSSLTRTPLFVVFTKEQGKWGVAVQRSGVPLK